MSANRGLLDATASAGVPWDPACTRVSVEQTKVFGQRDDFKASKRGRF